MSQNRVVITGMGIIAPGGNNEHDYWDTLVNGKSPADFINWKLSMRDEKDDQAIIKEVTNLDYFASKFACQVSNFVVEEHMDKKMAARMDKFVHFGVAAAKQAIEMAGIEISNNGVKRDRIGVIVGSGIGGMTEFSTNHERFYAEGIKRISPFFIPALITNMASGMIGIIYKFGGPNYSISTACATSNHCITEGFNTIRRGDADIMVCGGAESCVLPLGVGGFVVSRALSRRNDSPTTASRPFDKDRDGFVMGEGAGVVVLESEDSAKRRGVKILAEMLGGGISCDAYHITDPPEDGNGAIRAIKAAFRSANVPIERINYINCHGTSTPKGDKAEMSAIRHVMGSHFKNVKLNSTKSIIGHLLGAAGGAELFAIILQIQHKKLHPSINIFNLDPDCEGDIVINKPIDFEIDIALSNSFGFGGHNGTIVVGRYNN